MTPLMYSSTPGVVKSMSRYARRLSSVDSRPIESKRFLMVLSLSSAARIPLPSATRAFAVSCSSVCAMASLSLSGFRFPDYSGKRSRSGRKPSNARGRGRPGPRGRCAESVLQSIPLSEKMPAPRHSCRNHPRITHLDTRPPGAMTGGGRNVWLRPAALPQPPDKEVPRESVRTRPRASRHDGARAQRCGARLAADEDAGALAGVLLGERKLRVRHTRAHDGPERVANHVQRRQLPRHGDA